MGKELSRKPEQIKHRARRANPKKAKQELELLTEVGAMKPIEEWDFEELARGMPRGKNGKFNGFAPAWITPAVQEEIQKRLKRMYGQKLGGLAPLTIGVFHEFLTDPDVGKGDRLRAAMYVTDQVIGKPRQSVDLDAQVSSKEFLADILMVVDEEGNLVPADPHVIEGQAWDNDDQEPDNIPDDEEEDLKPLPPIRPDKPRRR